MRAAIEKAREGIKEGQTPFGACIVKDGKIISSAHNLVWENTDITAHAEIIAIREACEKLNTIDLSGCEIYTTCEPCTMCFSACHWAKIGKIVYGALIEDAKKAGFSELTIPNEDMKRLGNSPVEIVGNFMRGEALELFREWEKKGVKRVY
ncbi:nucleoside deaminase [Methanocella sp. CWC-04]|uniref:Nucleoside deaminase n=2 Tax=Methanooceanicella nereidis TaxID=2052831 RepID=A0AAP2W571_9EURY|nr:nucleoside deaminase [Methanocella sp. CWC-04]